MAAVARMQFVSCNVVRTKILRRDTNMKNVFHQHCHGIFYPRRWDANWWWQCPGGHRSPSRVDRGVGAKMATRLRWDYCGVHHYSLSSRRKDHRDTGGSCRFCRHLDSRKARRLACRCRLLDSKMYESSRRRLVVVGRGVFPIVHLDWWWRLRHNCLTS